MKVLLDGRLVGYGGAGVVTARCYRELIPLLLERGCEVTLALTDMSRARPECRPLLEIRDVAVKEVAAECLTISHHWRFPKEVEAASFDRYFYPHFDMPWFVPVRSVVFVHDLFPVLIEGYTSRLKRKYFDVVCRRSIAKARKVVVNSEWTRSTIIERYGTPQEKIVVAYLGCDHLATPSGHARRDAVIGALGGGEGYLLYVGNCKPHKNLSRLIRAYAALPAEVKEMYPLILVGPRDRFFPGLSDEIRALRAETFVHHVGPQDHETLEELYAGARALALVSLYEGFGMPPLEAMRYGVPCVVSDSTGLGEVAGMAALTVDPRDEDAIRKALLRLLCDEEERNSLSQRGSEYARRFTWRSCAEKVAAALTEE